MMPVLSRQTVSPRMAARGLKSAAELAAGKPCGTRVRYYAGCRCPLCKRANTDYESERARKRAAGEGNHLVSADAARKHLQLLSRLGVGYKTVADSAKVSTSVVQKIIRGTGMIRAQSERRILAVTLAAAADGAAIQAAATWRMLDELIACGYPRCRLASEMLGHPVRALQLSRKRVTVANAAAVARVYERLRYVSAQENKRAQRLLQELHDEGFRVSRVLVSMATEAERRGWPAPTLQPATKGQRAGHLRHQETVLLDHVHRLLMGEDR